MVVNRGHLRAIRLLPFAAAADKARLTLKRQMLLESCERIGLSSHLCLALLDLGQVAHRYLKLSRRG